jgi:3-dehydroquinate dehydratase-2
MRILLIQGANTNLFGKRDPALYGRTTAAEIDQMIQAHAARRGVDLEIRYTNSEA